MANPVIAGIKDVGSRVFGGYAELLRIPHTARYAIGAVIACMPFPMVGMAITISVQHNHIECREHQKADRRAGHLAGHRQPDARQTRR